MSILRPSRQRKLAKPTIIKLRGDADVGVEATISLDGKPLVDLFQPRPAGLGASLTWNGAEIAMTPAEADRLASALHAAAKRARAKAAK